MFGLAEDAWKALMARHCYGQGSDVLLPANYLKSYIN